MTPDAIAEHDRINDVEAKIASQSAKAAAKRSAAGLN